MYLKASIRQHCYKKYSNILNYIVDSDHIQPKKGSPENEGTANDETGK